MPGPSKPGVDRCRGPLAGLRVLELARILAGPWAGQILADLGADVIKVEREGSGDDTRAWGPPFVPAADGGNLVVRLFSLRQPRQALDRRRFHQAGRPAHRQKAGGALRRADREFQGRRARQIRPRLQEPRARQSAPDLLLGDRLRPDRAVGGARRLRSDGARHRRHHGHDRRGGRAADAGRRADRRYFLRRLCRGRHSRRAGAARAHRPRRLCRYRAGRFHRRHAGVPGAQLSGLRRSAQAHRQCPSQPRALSGISRQRRPRHHRHRQRRAIRQAVRHPRRA